MLKNEHIIQDEIEVVIIEQLVLKIIRYGNL